MKAFFFLILSFFIGTHSFGQGHGTHTSVSTEISSKNAFDISIIEVFPQDFPKVSVVFQAKNELGEPLWLLTKNDFGVRENAYECEILDVRAISKNSPLNLGLVFDHSASMVENPEFMTDPDADYQQLYFDNKLPPAYIMSIDYAKEAVLNFFSVDNQEKDSILFVGFSETVDEIPALTNDFSQFEKIVANVKPNGKTAFYDAIYNSIDSLKNHNSKAAIIALTDGQDNSSVHTSEEVIEFANENGIPIYIIGLGNAHSVTLGRICDQTNGFYYYTSDPTQLTEIYENIKKQIRSIYELDYLSNEDNSIDSLRRIKFRFTNDTLSYNYNEHEFALPEEVVQHLKVRKVELQKKQKELEKTEEFNQKLLIGGGIAAVVLLGIGGFMVVRRRRKKIRPTLIKVFPNPFSDQLTVNFSIPNAAIGNLLIMTVAGNEVRNEPISASQNSVQLNLSELENGTYVIVIKTATGMSNVLRVVKTK
ncbi:MAG: VWA domain-containing protein [Crocinitomix sp.]|nr:VWA domain-containing protein [Crocinitomix sp.]